MLERGVRFGKALQMTNILRDAVEDLRLGRCYFPEPSLAAVGISTAMLSRGEGLTTLERLLPRYLDRTLPHFRAGWEYTLAIPRRVPRLRLACAWPLFLGLRTLTVLAE